MTDELIEFADEYRDIWIAVLQVSLNDYWRGLRTGQHLKLGTPYPEHRTAHDRFLYQNWLTAAHWLLSDDTMPRSFLWLIRLLRLDPEDIYQRMRKPPSELLRMVQDTTAREEDEGLEDDEDA